MLATVHAKMDSLRAKANFLDAALVVIRVEAAAVKGVIERNVGLVGWC